MMMDLAPKFTFSLASSNQQRNKYEAQPKEAEEEKDFISGIDSYGHIIGGKRKKEAHPVIPLEDSWTRKYKMYEYQKIARGEATDPINSNNEQQSDSSDPRSLRSIPLADTSNNNIDETSFNYIMSLPPILRNRPPGLDKIHDEKDKFLFDVNCRPDEANLEAYESMPLDKFGEAMLRGMGWSHGMPIGKNSTHVQPVIQFIKQPERLGLGAIPKPQKPKPQSWIPKPGESRDPKPIMELPKDKDGKIRHWKTIDEKLKPAKEPFHQGAGVYVTKGVHSGLRASIELKQGTNAIVILPSDEKVVIKLTDLEQIDPQNNNNNPPKHNKKSKSKKDKRKKKSKKRKHSPSPSSSSSSSSSPKPKKLKKNPVQSIPPTSTHWVAIDTRVKICTKHLEGGRYYCKYAWVVDLLPHNRCVLRVEDTGVLLEGIDEYDLETVVPTPQGLIKVVRGERRGELGTVFEKDAQKGVVYVQLEEDMDIHKFCYDDVAQFRDSGCK